MSPGVRDRIMTDGAEPIGSTPAGFQEHLATEMAKWRKVVKSAGISVN
jgi:tripartite-type tricarboxylate transporter receptor subunit TctC